MVVERKLSPITGIRRVPITRASRIVEAGHSSVSGVIEVKFETGAVWQYRGFYAETWHAFLNAQDQQVFFDQHIYGREHAQNHICVTQAEDHDPRRREDDSRQGMAY